LALHFSKEEALPILPEELATHDCRMSSKGKRGIDGLMGKYNQ
jgi:hypothetical protein